MTEGLTNLPAGANRTNRLPGRLKHHQEEEMGILFMSRTRKEICQTHARDGSELSDKWADEKRNLPKYAETQRNCLCFRQMWTV